LLRDFWPCVHPQLDATDGDPTERLNAVEGLAHADLWLGALRAAPLLEARGIGRFSLREIGVAMGRVEARSGDTPVDAGIVQAAARSLDAARLAELHATLRQSRDDLNASARLFGERLTATDTPELAPLTGLLALAADYLLPFLPAGAETAGPVVSDEAAGIYAVATPQRAGEIANREDVVRAIDRICDYYSRHEPSSPVPMLLRRARGLVNKDFSAVLANLLPDMVDRLTVFTGPSES
jgi:type VI secretion system protein ImpA